MLIFSNLNILYAGSKFEFFVLFTQTMECKIKFNMTIAVNRLKLILTVYRRYLTMYRNLAFNIIYCELISLIDNLIT